MKAVGSVIQIFCILADFLFYLFCPLLRGKTLEVSKYNCGPMSPFRFICFLLVYFEDLFSGAYTFRVVISLGRIDLFTMLSWEGHFCSAV